MQEGTVKFFNETKGFGFINDSNTGNDVFVHISGLVDEIRQDDKVSFDTENTPKGISAINVKVM